MLQFAVSKIIVKPNPGGTRTIELWGTGRRYADLYINRPIETLIKMFPEGWTAGHFTDATIYNDLSMVADYKISSKLNSEGNPYKDVYAVRNA